MYDQISPHHTDDKLGQYENNSAPPRANTADLGPVTGPIRNYLINIIVYMTLARASLMARGQTKTLNFLLNSATD